MLSDTEIMRRLKAVRYSSRLERNARRAISMNGIATKAGISREYLHMIVSGQRPLTARGRVILSQVLTCEHKGGVGS